MVKSNELPNFIAVLTIVSSIFLFISISIDFIGAISILFFESFAYEYFVQIFLHLAFIFGVPLFGWLCYDEIKKISLQEIANLAKYILKHGPKALYFMVLGGILAYLAIYLTITQ